MMSTSPTLRPAAANQFRPTPASGTFPTGSFRPWDEQPDPWEPPASSLSRRAFVSWVASRRAGPSSTR